MDSPMDVQKAYILSKDGLRRYSNLQADAVSTVVSRFYQEFPSLYETFEEKGRKACEQDIGYHLEFLRPVIEFGILRPFIDYLQWLISILAARHIPAEHTLLSLDWLGDFFVTHLAPPDGAALLSALAAAKQELIGSETGKNLYLRGMPEAWKDSEIFEKALISGDQHKAVEIFHKTIADGNDFIDTELHLVQPALYEIGRKWQNNQVSVAQEHLATAIVQGILAREFAYVHPAPRIGKRVILACVEGNQHAVGLRIVADAFEIMGWDIIYLGASTPTLSLFQMVYDLHPDLVGLSISLPQHFSAVRELISQMRAFLGADRPPLIIGGIAINQFQPLKDILGADLTSADAKSAVVVSSRFLSG